MFLMLLPFCIGMGAFILSAWPEQSFIDIQDSLLVALIAVEAGFMLGLTAPRDLRATFCKAGIRQSKRIQLTLLLQSLIPRPVDSSRLRV
jgi:hypothetical protein